MTKTNDQMELIPKSESKQDKLIRYLFSEPTIKQAALKAGYAESTAENHIYTMIKKPAFLNKLKEYAVQHDIIDLGQIARIETKILNQVEQNINEYPKFKDIFRQKKQIAGILSSDEQRPMIQTINIKDMRVLIKNDI
ncbi:hypothetical protein ACFL6B_01875 [Thermodesulfobacteriota bacterium]